jgi:hypothetical protein
LRTAIVFFSPMINDARRVRIKSYLRKAQKSLGQLNDDAKGHSLATALQRDGVHVPL